MVEWLDPHFRQQSKRAQMKGRACCPESAAPSREIELPHAAILVAAATCSRQYWRRWNNRRQRSSPRRVCNGAPPQQQNPPVRSFASSNPPNRTPPQPVGEKIAAFHSREFFRAD